MLRRDWMRLALVAIAAAMLLQAPLAQTPEGFGARIAALSEPAGYFDTDNLISNEASYLQVIPALASLGGPGGAYIGVGPDQNFTYIAAVRPSIAFILDIRRDNMLLHLLFKALFAMADTRVEYLSLLFGREPPPQPAGWRAVGIDRIVAHVERRRMRHEAIASLRARVDEGVGRLGVPLSDSDRRTIDRFHRRFIEAGPDLRFQSTGRPPRSSYPTYRELLLASDPSGTRSCFQASEDAYAFVRELQARDLVIPVMGDVSGPKAMLAIGRFLAHRRERVSAIYVSNVESYLFGDGRFAGYIANLGKLPTAPGAVVIRSAFGPYASNGWRGGYSSSHVQPLSALLQRWEAGEIRRYADVLARD
jgi:hypothetical protein